MPQVYIVTTSNHDFTDAKRFGEITFIKDGCLPRYQVQQMVRVFQPIIDHSSPSDYIMSTGLTVAQNILCSMFSLKHKKLNLLIHNGKNRYVERVIEWKEN